MTQINLMNIIKKHKIHIAELQVPALSVFELRWLLMSYKTQITRY